MWEDSEGLSYRCTELQKEPYLCAICHLVAEDPVSPDGCNHAFCRHCIDDRSSCPKCSIAVEPDELVERKDMRKGIDTLEVDCPNKSHGCEWTGRRQRVFDHRRNDCQHTPCPIYSPLCSWVGPVTEVTVHWKTDCQLCLLECPSLVVGSSCPYEGPRQQMNSHARVCKYVKSKLLLRICPPEDQVRTLCVGTTKFKTSLGTLRRVPSSALAALLEDEERDFEDSEAEIFLDVPPQAFEHILVWLQCSYVPTLSGNTRDLVTCVARFLNLEEFADLVEGKESPATTVN